jgi:acetyl esterase/lipase
MKQELGMTKQRAAKLRAGITAIEKSLAKAKSGQPIEAMQARRDKMEQELASVDEQMQSLEIAVKAEADQKVDPEFDGVDVKRDVEFSSGVFLDLWTRTDAGSQNPAPIFVGETHPTETSTCSCGTLMWLHGGGWKVGSHHNLPPFIRKLVLRGYTVASVGYTKSTKAKFPTCLHDCKVW